jgi:hypothetical protein
LHGIFIKKIREMAGRKEGHNQLQRWRNWVDGQTKLNPGLESANILRKEFRFTVA